MPSSTPSDFPQMRFNHCYEFPVRKEEPRVSRALFLRVKRRLAHDGLFLHAARENSREFSNLGRYHTVNIRNIVQNSRIDLLELAKELKVI